MAEEGVAEEEAKSKIFLLDSRGLVVKVRPIIGVFCSSVCVLLRSNEAWSSDKSAGALSFDRGGVKRKGLEHKKLLSFQFHELKFDLCKSFCQSSIKNVAPEGSWIMIFRKIPVIRDAKALVSISDFVKSRFLHKLSPYAFTSMQTRTCRIVRNTFIF